MDDAGFILGSYIATFGAIALYAWATLRRGRRLSREVPPDEQYWT